MKAADANAAVITDPNSINFGCSPLDFMCLGEESVAKQAAQMIASSVAFIFESTAFNDTTTLWTVATNMSQFWWTIVFFVVVMVVALGLGIGAVMGDKKMMIRAIVGLFGTFIITFSAIHIVGIALVAIDGTTAPLLNYATSEGSIQQMLMKLLYPTDFSRTTGDVGIGGILLGIVAFLIGLGLMAFINAVRTLGLEVLIAFAPLAFALLGTKTGGGWIKNWFAAVVALMLTKPLTLGLLVLSIKGAGSIGSLYTIEALPIFIGLAMSLFMPLLAFGMFSFLGTHAAGATEAVGHRLGGHAKHIGGSIARGTRGKFAGGGGRAGATPPGTGGPNRPPMGANPTAGAAFSSAMSPSLKPSTSEGANHSGTGGSVAQSNGPTGSEPAPDERAGGSVQTSRKPAAIQQGRFQQSAVRNSPPQRAHSQKSEDDR